MIALNSVLAANHIDDSHIVRCLQIIFFVRSKHKYFCQTHYGCLRVFKVEHHPRFIYIKTCGTAYGAGGGGHHDGG